MIFSQSPEIKAIRAAWFSISSSMALALIKGVAGMAGHSDALIADSVESTTDILAALLMLLGLRYARRPADENHPYGHGKIEPLITFIVVAFLVTSAAAIAYRSVREIQSGQQQVPEAWTMGVLALIILWKEISYRYMKRRSAEVHSTSLAADAWHHRSDAITSLIALAGIGLAQLGGPSLAVADDAAALLAAGFILYNSYHIFRPALGEVMDEHRYEELEAAVRDKAREVPGIRDTEKCHVRKSGMRYYIDLHAIVDAGITVREGHALGHQLEDHLQKQIPQIDKVLVHVEPDESESLRGA